MDDLRKMLPLTTAWAFTIWKDQGHTCPILLDIGKDEREHGLAYVAFSCATRFSNIGIANRVYFDCLTRQIKNQSKMKCRLLHEKHLESLYQDTILAMDGYTCIPSNPSNIVIFIRFLFLIIFY